MMWRAMLTLRLILLMLGLIFWYVDDDACEAGVILAYFEEVQVILDAFHVMKRYGDSTVGTQHPAHNCESQC